MKDSLSSEVYLDWKAERERVVVSISGFLVVDVCASVSATLLAGVTSPLNPRGVAPGVVPILDVAPVGMGVMNRLFRAARACLLRV